MLWDILIVIGIVWIIMSILSFLQNVLIKNIQAELTSLGKVYHGKNAGFMRTSLIVFIALNDKGNVVEAKKLRVTRVLIPPKTFAFQEIKNRNIKALFSNESEFDKNTTLALNDLYTRYLTTQKNKA